MLPREKPNLKLVLLDGPLGDRAERLVRSANRFALGSRVFSSSDFDGLAPYAVAVLLNPERSNLVHQGNGLFCNSERDFWAVSQRSELALTPLRKGMRLVVSSNELEDASNKPFEIFMNSELVLKPAYSQMFTDIMIEELLSSAEGANDKDLRTRLHYAISLVASVYANMPSAPRVKRGNLHLLHLESAFGMLQTLARSLNGDPESFTQLADFVFPCFSLPNPQSGWEFDVDSPVHDSIISTITENWGTTDTAQQSIARVKLSRNRRDHPRITPPMDLESWPWTRLDRLRADQGHENGFLAWQLINESDPNRATAFFSRRASAGLTEGEFFDPKVDASPIEGEWSDGSPLVDRKVSNEIVIAQAASFDATKSEFVSEEVTLFLEVVPGIVFEQARISEVIVTFAENATLRFEARSHQLDSHRERLVIRGVFRGFLAPRGEEFEFAPKTWIAEIQCPPDLMQFVLPTQGRKVLMLPLQGTGYLVGPSLTYYGPQIFDPTAAPMDQQTEYECELDNGDAVTVIAWSGAVPANIKVESPKVRDVAPDVSRKSIRLVETFVADSEPMRIVQENV